MADDPAAFVIRPAGPTDAVGICAIYNPYVSGTIVSFEEAPLGETEMARHVDASVLPWLVALEAGLVVGYARAAPWTTRSGYRHTVESSVYVDPARQRRGHGRQLYEALIARLQERGVHCVIGGIALPNPASIALHEALGFEHAGVLREVGRKLGRWVDVGYWVLLL
jgi:phosphinothricin acetyltransferase